MKVIVAGSRDYEVYDVIARHLDANLPKEGITILHGGCRGVDLLAKRWADERGIPSEEFPARWKEEGKSAGARRNLLMAEAGDALLAFPSGGPGTAMMIRMMRDRGKPVKVIPVGVSTDVPF